jgi:hypothetical protein
MRSTCKHCGKHFYHERAGAQYCSTAHRVAALRQRSKPLPRTRWLGKQPTLSPRVRREGELSNAELGQRLIEISAKADSGKPKTGRRFYYIALSYGYINPDMSATEEGVRSRDAAYDRITHVLKVLRMQGELGWGDVIDLTRELDQWQTYRSAREAREHLRRRYDEDRWDGQSFYPVLVVEKDTMEPVLRPVAMRWQMPFASSRGYSSLKLQHDTAAAIRERYAKTKQDILVFFVSDLDPSGLDLQRAWEDALEDFGAYVRLELIRIALTRKQVEDHAEGAARRGIEAKMTDSRWQSYYNAHGEWSRQFTGETGYARDKKGQRKPIIRCWELDAIPADVIEAELELQIRFRLDLELWNRRGREIERARALL